MPSLHNTVLLRNSQTACELVVCIAGASEAHWLGL